MGEIGPHETENHGFFFSVMQIQCLAGGGPKPDLLDRISQIFLEM